MRVRVRTLTHSPYPPIHPPIHPLTHLSVFKDKQPGVVLSPWRKTHVVHLISVLTHTKIEPCRRTEKLKPKASSQAINLTIQDDKRRGEQSKVCLDRQAWGRKGTNLPTQPTWFSLVFLTYS